MLHTIWNNFKNHFFALPNWWFIVSKLYRTATSSVHGSNWNIKRYKTNVWKQDKFFYCSSSKPIMWCRDIISKSPVYPILSGLGGTIEDIRFQGIHSIAMLSISHERSGIWTRAWKGEQPMSQPYATMPPLEWEHRNPHHTCIWKKIKRTCFYIYTNHPPLTRSSSS